MTKKVNDPVSYLKGLVSGRGKSSSDGVYYAHCTVMAEVEGDYGYEMRTSPKWDADYAYTRSSEKLNETLVQLRKESGIVVSSYMNVKDFIQFISEDHDLTMSVTIPTVTLEDFAYKVVYYQTFFKKVAKFAGKTPTQIRFFIGTATMSWEELVDSGEAQEIDVGF